MRKILLGLLLLIAFLVGLFFYPSILNLIKLKTYKVEQDALLVNKYIDIPKEATIKQASAQINIGWSTKFKDGSVSNNYVAFYNTPSIPSFKLVFDVTNTLFFQEAYVEKIDLQTKDEKAFFKLKVKDPRAIKLVDNNIDHQVINPVAEDGVKFISYGNKEISWSLEGKSLSNRELGTAGSLKREESFIDKYYRTPVFFGVCRLLLIFNIYCFR